MSLVARRLFLAALGLATLIALAILFVDRPVARIMHAQFEGIPIFLWLYRFIEVAPPLATAVLAGGGLAALAGWRPGPRGRAVLAASLAILVAIAIKDELKFAFGRTWPRIWLQGQVDFIDSGLFNFFPFHGGADWASFPSGHTTLIAAPCAALWRAWPRLRWLFVLLPVVVIIGLIGSDGHFVSDVLAGLLFGIAIGLGMAALLRVGHAA